MSARAVPRIRRHLGQSVRATRQGQRLSQVRLGRLAHLSGKFIGEVERAEKSISVDSLFRVARALDTRIRDLVSPFCWGVAVLLFAGCATGTPGLRAQGAATGPVNVNLMSPEVIRLVCQDKAGCSEQVYYDGVPRVITIWCTAGPGALACIAHEVSHIARRSSAEE